MTFQTPSSKYTAELNRDPRFLTSTMWALPVTTTHPSPGIPSLLQRSSSHSGWGSVLCDHHPGCQAEQAGVYLQHKSDTLSSPACLFSVTITGIPAPLEQGTRDQSQGPTLYRDSSMVP